MESSSNRSPCARVPMGVRNGVAYSGGGVSFWIVVFILAILLLIAGWALYLQWNTSPDIHEVAQSLQVKRYKLETPASQTFDTEPVIPPSGPQVLDSAEKQDGTGISTEQSPETPSEDLRIRPETPVSSQIDIPADSALKTADASAAAVEPQRDLLPSTQSAIATAPSREEPDLRKPGVENSQEPEKGKAKNLEKAAPLPKAVVHPEVSSKSVIPNESSREAENASGMENLDKITVSVPLGIARKKPSLNADVAFRMERAETVAVLEKKGHWWHVQNSQGQQGWAHQKLFRKETASQQPEEPPPLPAATGRIHRLEITAGSMGGDIVLFHIDQDRPPKTIVLEGEKPRIVCDFPEMAMAPGLLSGLPGKSDTVEKIRSGIHGPPESMVRIVLDLFPNHNYTVRQIYDRANKRYILHILRKTEGPDAG